MTIIFGRIKFHCPLTLILAYLLFLVLFLNLGIWQLGRAKEKQVLLDKQAKMIQAKPLQLLPALSDSAETLRYRKVTINGHYDVTKQFLLDNQIFKGKAGYFVFTPFLIAGSNKAVLINRGWLVTNANRNVLPDVTVDIPVVKNQENLTVTGRINHFPSVGIKLAGGEIPTNTHPALIQRVDVQVLAKKLGYSLFPFQVELDAQMPAGYTRQWQITTLMPPQQHFGYALQWFGLALVLSFLFFWYSCKYIR